MKFLEGILKKFWNFYENVEKMLKLAKTIKKNVLQRLSQKNCH